MSNIPPLPISTETKMRRFEYACQNARAKSKLPCIAIAVSFALAMAIPIMWNAFGACVVWLGFAWWDLANHVIFGTDLDAAPEETQVPPAAV